MTRQYQYLFTTLVEPPGGEQVNAPLCIYIYRAAFIYGYDIPVREYRWRSFLTLSPCVCQEQSHSSVLYFSWKNNPLSFRDSFRDIDRILIPSSSRAWNLFSSLRLSSLSPPPSLSVRCFHIFGEWNYLRGEGN